MNSLFVNNAWWIIPAVVVVATLLLGLSDVMRLSFGRILAISSVCFRESLRRRVLLVIPLAILGVLAVSAFIKPIDYQDAIRQQLKFCLFASGMLIVLTLLILACTNLPREIESRVIYTIVTKPTTRLEIVLGKVLGFARVSGLVLGIMGVFTVGYLGFTSLRYQGIMAERLKSGEVQAWEKTSFEHYREFGLLTAKQLVGPKFGGIHPELPSLDEKAEDVRWFRDAAVNDILIPFKSDAALLNNILAQDEKDPNQTKLAVIVDLYSRGVKPLQAGGGAPTSQPLIPTPLLEAPVGKATTSFAIYSRYGETLIDSAQLGARDMAIGSAKPGESTRTVFYIPRAYVRMIAEQPSISLQIGHVSPDKELGVGVKVAAIVLTDAQGNPLAKADGSAARLEPYIDPVVESRQMVSFRGRQGRAGQQQVRGGADGQSAVALYRFRKAPIAADVKGDMSLEMNVGVERDAPDAETDKDEPTHLEFAFYNLNNPGAAPIKVSGYPENNRTIYVTVPPAAVAGGNFDVAVTCVTSGHWFTAGGQSSLLVVTDRQSFALNLGKSLLVLWMMSLLVIITSVCCSTFLSWPIAVVLTLVILLARWGVVQLGDSIQSGIGNQVATQMGFKDAAGAVAVSRSVEALSAGLRTIAEVLPDISQFSALEDIEQGLQMPMVILANSGLVLLLFGLPLLALSYVFLRYKEVAP